MIGVLLMLSACALPAAPTPAPVLPQSNTQQPNGATGPQVITFGIYAFERSLYQPFVEQFNQQNLDVQVQIVLIDPVVERLIDKPWGEELARAVLSAADTTTTRYVLPEFFQADYVVNLTDFMQADASFNQADFYPMALPPTNTAPIYLLPSTVWVNTVGYNKQIWDSKGLPSPPTSLPWQEFLSLSEQLAEQQNEQPVYGFVDVTPYWHLRRAILAEGINLQTTALATVDLTARPFVAALEQTVQQARTKILLVKPRDTSGLHFDNQRRELILNGQVGMWPSADFVLIDDRVQQYGLTFEVGTLVRDSFPGQAPTVQGYLISAGTQHPDEAWRWIHFLSQQHTVDFMGYADPSIAPARRSLAERQRYFDQFAPDLATAIQRFLEEPGTPREANDSTALLQPLLEDAFFAVLNDDQSAEQVLAIAQTKFQERLIQVRATATDQPPSAPIVVATSRPATASTATRINFGVSGSLEESVRAAANQFNAEQDAVEVVIKTDPTARSISDIAVENDCFVWPAPPTAEDTVSLMDLRPFLDADATLPATAFPSAVLASMQHDGTLYGLPLHVMLPTLGVNQILLDQAGLTLPSDAQADDMLALAQQLTSGNGDQRQYGYASATGNLTDDVRFWLGRLKARLGTMNGDQLQPTLTDPQTVAAARTILTLLRDHTPHTHLTGYSQSTLQNSDQGRASIEAGQVGLWVNQFNTGLSAMPTTTFTPQVAPIPLAGVGLTTEDVGVSGLYIKVVTPHAQACWQWLVALSGGDAAVSSGSNYSLRLAARSTNTDSEQQALATLYRTALNQPAGFTPTVPLWLDPFWFYRAVDRAVQGGDLERELQEAQTLTEAHLACIQGGGQPGPCARQVDPTYEGFSQ
jgi:ABC-type glycerol-3-phosphate transport system substrate-binding protein